MEITEHNEICQCGHFKVCHQPHQLDKHGGQCSHCDCNCYTWKEFYGIKKGGSGE